MAANPAGQDVPEELLSSVADKLSGKFFRAGVLLNIQPHELDRIEVASEKNLWRMNMDMLRRWQEDCPPGEERLQLARVLKRLGLGRMAKEVDPQVDNNPGPITFINPGVEEFSLQELDEIACEVCNTSNTWERLAIYLGLGTDVTQQIKAAHRDDVLLQCFKCLWRWYEQGENVSKQALADALRQIDKRRLAAKISP